MTAPRGGNTRVARFKLVLGVRLCGAPGRSAGGQDAATDERRAVQLAVLVAELIAAGAHGARVPPTQSGVAKHRGADDGALARGARAPVVRGGADRAAAAQPIRKLAVRLLDQLQRIAGHLTGRDA